MPALPSIPNVLRVDWRFSDSLDLDVDTRFFYLYSGGPPNDAACLALATSIFTAAAVMYPFWSPEVQLTSVTVTDLSSSTGGVGEYFGSQAGDRGGPVMPAGVAVLVNYAIGRRYRGGKPRSYLVFFVADDMATTQTWEAASVTSLHAALVTYFAAVIGLASGGVTITQHVNVSYYSGFLSSENPVTHRWRNISTPRAVPLVDQISSFAVNGIPSSQRRRNRA